MQEKEVGHRGRSGVLRLEEQALTNQDKSKHIFKVEGLAVSSEEQSFPLLSGWSHTFFQLLPTLSQLEEKSVVTNLDHRKVHEFKQSIVKPKHFNIRDFEKIQHFLGSKQTKKLSGKNLNNA